MQKCPRCHKNQVNVDHELGVLPCDDCQKKDAATVNANLPEFVTLTKQERIVNQRDKHGKEILQPWTGKDWKPNRDFVKAYPKYAKQYFTKEQLNKL